MWLLPDYLAKLNGGSVAHRLKIQDKCSQISKYILEKTKGKNLTMKRYAEVFGGRLLDGYNIRYIYFIDKNKIKDLTVPVLPYKMINELGAGMYKGVKKNACLVQEKNSDQPVENGGATPNNTLHN